MKTSYIDGKRAFATAGTSWPTVVRILVPSLSKTSRTVEEENLLGGQKILSLIARVEQ
jgi:hypothetical protein